MQSVEDKIIRYAYIPLLFVFAFAYEQKPLYAINQNTYFLHGLANAGAGFLKLDWLAQTIDPFPVFSFLVKIILQFPGEHAFYFIYVGLLAVFFHSILGIVCEVMDIRRSRVTYLTYSALITILYSGLLNNLLAKLPGSALFSMLFSPDGLLTIGIAGQFVLGATFQPSTFGVLILLSMYMFLRGKTLTAIIFLATAATIHSSYLLCAVIMTSTYLTIIYAKTRDIRKLLLPGVFAFALVLPVFVYNLIHFLPTNAEITAQAQDILVNYRFPHHARPLDWQSIFQSIVVIISLYLTRKTRLFQLMLLPFLMAAALTAVQLITGSASLALLFPWRISVVLIPIASSVILAYIVNNTFRYFRPYIEKYNHSLYALIIFTVLAIGCHGAIKTITLLNSPKTGMTDSVKYITGTATADHVYLIPPDIESFRMAAKVPILVDFKSHPYKDVEIVEWRSRLALADSFYSADQKTACGILDEIRSKYAVSHVLMRNESKRSDCGGMIEMYKDSDFIVYKISDFK